MRWRRASFLRVPPPQRFPSPGKTTSSLRINGSGSNLTQVFHLFPTVARLAAQRRYLDWRESQQTVKELGLQDHRPVRPKVGQAPVAQAASTLAQPIRAGGACSRRRTLPTLTFAMNYPLTKTSEWHSLSHQIFPVFHAFMGNAPLRSPRITYCTSLNGSIPIGYTSAIHVPFCSDCRTHLLQHCLIRIIQHVVVTMPVPKSEHHAPMVSRNSKYKWKRAMD